MILVSTSITKQIALFLAVLQACVACWLIRQVWEEPLDGVYGIVFLIAGALGYVEVMAVRRAMGLLEGPIIDWSLRGTWMIVAGFGLAVLLAVGLTVVEYQGRVTSQQMENDAAAERASRSEIGRSVDIKSLMRQLQEKKTTQPASN